MYTQTACRNRRRKGARRHATTGSWASTGCIWRTGSAHGFKASFYEKLRELPHLDFMAAKEVYFVPATTILTLNTPSLRSLLSQSISTAVARRAASTELDQLEFR